MLLSLCALHYFMLICDQQGTASVVCDYYPYKVTCDYEAAPCKTRSTGFGYNKTVGSAANWDDILEDINTVENQCEAV